MEGDHVGGYGSQLPLGKQAKGGSHLVVAAAAGMEFGSGRASQLGYPTLNGGVDVLVAGREDKVAGGQLHLGLVEGNQDLGRLVLIQQADVAQHPDVGSGPGDVVGGQPDVEGDAGGVGHQLICRIAVESSVPQRAHVVPAFISAGPACAAAGRGA